MAGRLMNRRRTKAMRGCGLGASEFKPEKEALWRGMGSGS